MNKIAFNNDDIELDWLKQWALFTPNANAFCDAESSAGYTYSKLFQLSLLLADHLKKIFKIESGSRVAVLSTNELEFVPLFFAVQRLGAILVPINFRLSARELAHILSDCSPELIIVQNQFSTRLAEALRQCSSDGTDDSARSQTSDLEPNLNIRCGHLEPARVWNMDGLGSLNAFLESAPTGTNVPEAFAFQGGIDSPCMLLYTSGTTGAPKGAMITNKMLHWNSLNTQLRLDISQRDVTVAFAPFFHTGGWNVLLTPYIHRGASTLFLRKFDPKKILEIIETKRVTMFFGVPTMLDMISQCPEFSQANLSSVRFAIVGGEPMPLELIKVWENKGVPIRQGFGLTEFGPNVFSLNEEDSLRKIGSIGFPNFYVQAKVVDDLGNSVAPGSIGELVLKGPTCTPGYWKNEHATRESIRDGWFFTGDLVRQDKEGYYYVAGRKKDMFISGGENVYPVEVESFLTTHPAVHEAAVIGIPDTRWGEVGKAYLVLREGHTLKPNDILNYCSESLAKFKIPKQIEFLSALPKSDSGKILKRELRATLVVFCLLAFNLLGCQTAPLQRFENIRVGMDKSFVVETLGSPTRTLRRHGRDIWIYEFTDRSGALTVREVVFEEGRAVYAGAKQAPAVSADEQDRRNELANKAEEERLEKIEENRRRALGAFGPNTPASDDAVEKKKRVPVYEEIR